MRALTWLFPWESLPFGERWRIAGSYLSPDTVTALSVLKRGLPWFKDCGVYIHRIDRPDSDRALHNHPYTFGSFILSGGYRQEVLDPRTGQIRANWRRPGEFAVMPRTHFHRVTELVDGEPCWTLLLAGKPVWTADGVHEWGFDVDDKYVHWRDYRRMKR